MTSLNRAAYMREYRSKPDKRAAERRREAAALRARTRLVAAHPEEYRRLYMQELERGAPTINSEGANDDTADRPGT